MLVKPAIALAMGIISSYFCALYIVRSEQFENYMYDMLKDYENPSAAMVGLAPEFIVFVNLIVSIVVHLVAISLYKLLKSSLITSLLKRILLVLYTLLFIGFCTMTLIRLTNVYEGYLIPTLIPKVFWISYGCILFLIFFKSQKSFVNLAESST